MPRRNSKQFRNALRVMRACMKTFETPNFGEGAQYGLRELSKSETDARDELTRLCTQIHENYGDCPDYRLGKKLD